jgi:hypothetical protein
VISRSPQTWQQLQEEVALILNECGLSASTDLPVELVRGTADIDVFAIDQSHQPHSKIIIECKHWKKAVPKTVVHSIRTVVADYGAHRGMVISTKGFQSGAVEAANQTNVDLLDWEQFQAIFTERWIRNYFCPKIHEVTERLVRLCCEPFGGYPMWLPETNQNAYVELEKKYAALAFLAEAYLMQSLTGQSERPLIVKLPMTPHYARQLCERNLHKGNFLPTEVLAASCFRDLLQAIVSNAKSAYQEFDSLRIAAVDTTT